MIVKKAWVSTAQRASVIGLDTYQTPTVFYNSVLLRIVSILTLKRVIFLMMERVPLYMLFAVYLNKHAPVKIGHIILGVEAE